MVEMMHFHVKIKHTTAEQAVQPACRVTARHFARRQQASAW
ncbi:unnamed protein product [Amoebophrya sp. A120]|nr:unnamed protein product [Amoebophrya sp. A120]|eukprot:GSA120T00014815001.1